jgi:hypothetical protein
MYDYSPPVQAKLDLIVLHLTFKTMALTSVLAAAIQAAASCDQHKDRSGRRRRRLETQQLQECLRT